MGMTGHCQCGAVRFEAPLDKPEKVYFCHCLECRWQSASAYGLSAIFPVFEFSDEARASMNVWTRITYRNKRKDCYFCKTCGTRLYHHCVGSRIMVIKAGCLDGLTSDMLKGATHIWAKRAITPIPEGVMRFQEEDEEEAEKEKEAKA